MKFNQLKTKQSENLAKAGEGEYCLLAKKMTKAMDLVQIKK